MCETLQETIKDLKIINIGQFAKENNCLGEWDEKYESYEIDEDKIIDELEEIISGGNVVVEHHVTDLFPERDVLSLDQNNIPYTYTRNMTHKQQCKLETSHLFLNFDSRCLFLSPKFIQSLLIFF